MLSCKFIDIFYIVQHCNKGWSFITGPAIRTSKFMSCSCQRLSFSISAMVQLQISSAKQGRRNFTVDVNAEATVADVKTAIYTKDKKVNMFPLPP